jgi:RNA polymerase sigma-70 factor (sigma-E family)
MSSMEVGLTAVGDRDVAIEVLFRNDHRKLLALAALVLRDADAAEDIVQEAYARVYVAWSSIAADEARSAYVRRTVINLSRSRIRRLMTARKHRSGAVSYVVSAEDQALRQSDWSPVVAAVRDLPRRQRECLSLRYVFDLSEAEIADALGISPGAVKGYTHRGLKKLAAELDEDL